MKTLKELQLLIIQWAKDKDLTNSEKQRLKLIEECGELASAILKNNKELQQDAIGDIFVVLIILAEQTNVNIRLDKFTPQPVFDLYGTILTDILHRKAVQSSIDFLNDICILLKFDLTECANLAWETIKNRTGITVNGIFLKNQL